MLLSLAALGVAVFFVLGDSAESCADTAFDHRFDVATTCGGAPHTGRFRLSFQSGESPYQSFTPNQLQEVSGDLPLESVYVDGSCAREGAVTWSTIDLNFHTPSGTANCRFSLNAGLPPTDVTCTINGSSDTCTAHAAQVN